jgi:hypothetical protein
MRATPIALGIVVARAGPAGGDGPGMRERS